MRILKKGLEISSWNIYERRYQERNLTINDMEELLKRESTEYLTKEQSFLNLFDIKPSSNEIVGMIYEQFLEYFVACSIIRGCREGILPFPFFLEKEIRPEINRIVRSLWLKEKNEYLESCLMRLWEAYEDNLDFETYTAITIRNHSIYYIGRIPIIKESVIKKLTVADRIEENLFVQLSIAFSFIKLGDYDREERFYRKLTSNSDWDKANRGYHLVYWGDWIVDAYEPPYFDDGKIDWEKSFENLLEHIENTQLEYVMLRRVELLTIRRFIEERKLLGRLNKDNFDKIRNSINCEVYKNEDFKKKVYDEFVKLEQIFIRLNEIKLN